VGGTPVLYQNVYTRLPGAELVILTDVGSSPGPDRRGDRVTVLRRPIRLAHWGLLTPVGAWKYGSLAARIRRASTRSTFIHCGRALPEGLGALIALAGGGRYACWAHGEELLYYQASRELASLARVVYRRAHAIIANSHSTAIMLGEFGISPHRITVIHPGVDVERFDPAVDGSEVRERYMVGREELLLLSVGRLQRRKGHDLVLSALALLRDRNYPIRYLIVGTGPDEMRLRELSESLGVARHVFFAGAIDDRVLPAHYAACDIFVLPNRATEGDLEGFGMVFLEAAAMERVVIGGNSGGVPEAIDAPRTGLLVSGTDAQELADAIGRLAANGDIRGTMGRAGRERVVREFTWRSAAERLQHVNDDYACSSRLGVRSRSNGHT
jgi:phosphatidylinositol alpha-1,6-mannosyltransferase